ANEEKFLSAWKELFPSDRDLKTPLITRSSRGDQDISRIEVKALSPTDYKTLLTEKLDAECRQSVRIHALRDKFSEKTDHLPRTVTMMVKALSYFGVDASGLSMLEKELEEASENYNVNYVNYNELITYWILEGYLGSDQSMTKLYEKGHYILMKLMDCGILKDQESGYLFMNKSFLKDDVRDQCLDEIPSLGLATVFRNDTERFGKLAHCKDGIHFDQGALVEFLEVEKELQILAFFNPTFQSLPTPLETMNRLRILVLRGCAYLEDIYLRLRNLEDNNLPFKELCVLEISGARSLKEMKVVFFNDMPLKSLNLSKLQITSLPLSIYNLEQLQKVGYLETLNLSGTSVERLPLNIANPHFLYLKSCLQLKQLSCIDSLVRIEVLDLSGSKNLKDLEDDFFDRMTCLRVLNLSETDVAGLPSLSELSNLRELYLSHCTTLKQFPSLESATNLEVLDVSKCSTFEDIGNSTFEQMIFLRKLDLSETKISYLPVLPNPNDLRQLLLKKALQNFALNSSLLNLEVLNVAGITSLASNGAEPVKDMSKLEVLDMSLTHIEGLPSVSNLKHLTHLSLAGCKNLSIVLDLDHLSKLEVLDLSGSSVKSLPKFSSSKNLLKLL
nr:hypothetical protein [Tanacetum cinerariifolium]